MNRRRVTVLYSGRVQGVGFRYNARSVSAGFEVAGTVRNLSDGRVELVAEGLPEELAEFLKAVRESGVGALIRNEETVWSEAQGGLRGFEITK